MLCNACGAIINEGADACPNCGAAVAETSASSEQAPDNQTLEYGDAPASYETTKLATEADAARARHILIKTDPQDLGEAAPDKEEARKKAQSILERIRNGEEFDALAQQNSDDERSKVAGGDLGFFGRGSMVPQFEQAAFSLKPGEVSDLVETEYGFHIIKVEEQREPSLDDPEFQDQIVKKLDAGKLEKKIDEIAAASKVEVAEDFKIDAPTPAPPAFPQGGERPF